MSRKLRRYDPTDLARIEQARNMLRVARQILRVAGADRAASSVSRSLKSVDGARRHAERLRFAVEAGAKIAEL